MKLEFSAGAVVFTHDGNTIKYALVVERSGHCGFPKGHIEPGEEEKETALREIFEETGVHARLIGDFYREVEYNIGARKRKHVSYFLAEFDNSESLTKASDIRSLYLLPFKAAMSRLTHENSRAILRDAKKYIEKALTEAI